MSMSTYRVVWMLVMVFIVVPAFVMASGMEGLAFKEASLYTLSTLDAYGVPRIIGVVIGYPVTILATLLPGTSTLATLLGDFIWKGLGIVFLTLFFILLEPPFYREEADTE